MSGEQRKEHQEISESEENENENRKGHKTGQVKCKQEIKRVKKHFKIPLQQMLTLRLKCSLNILKDERQLGGWQDPFSTEV